MLGGSLRFIFCLWLATDRELRCCMSSGFGANGWGQLGYNTNNIHFARLNQLDQWMDTLPFLDLTQYSSFGADFELHDLRTFDGSTCGMPRCVVFVQIVVLTVFGVLGQ